MVNTQKGIILADILIAFSLAALFIAIISESSSGARDIFTYAQEKNELLDAYETDLFSSTKQPYGNDRIQETFASSSLQYVNVFASPLANWNEAAGTPLCIVDFLKGNNVVSTITPILLPINLLLPLTHLEVRNGIAYVSADSSIASDADLFIANIQDVNHPTILSSINTGPGIASFTIAGRRIYAAAASTAAQLHIIRMDSLVNLFLEKKYQLPLPYATATSPMASSIFYNLGYIYLGTEKWSGEEFNIFDVSNPIQPARLGGLEIGSKINDIFVRDGFGYIAASDASQLRIIDVFDPIRPTVLNSFSPSGWQRQEGKVVLFFENALSFGRTSGGFNLIQDHEAFAWATISSMTLSDPISVDIAGGVYGMIVDRSHIYLATRQVNKELQIFDRTLSVASSTSFSLPIAPQSMTCDNDKLYILAHSAPYIYEISFQ